MRMYVVEILRQGCARSDVFLFSTREEAEWAVDQAWKYEDVYEAAWHQADMMTMEGFTDTMVILTGETL